MMWSTGMWGFGLLWMVLFWGLLIAGIVWLVQAAVDRPQRRTGTDDPRQLLDERFARGELSTQEYEERRRVLDTGR